MNAVEFELIWRPYYSNLTKATDVEALHKLSARLMPFAQAYGRGDRASAAAHFAMLMTPPAYQDKMPYLIGHLILWLFGIDGVLDICDTMEPAYDLHTVAMFAAHNPDVELSPQVLAGLGLKTDVTQIWPGCGCSVLMLGMGAQQLVRDIRTAYHDADNLALFLREFDREVWAEVTEALWRVEQSWHDKTIDEYIALGGASIANIVTASLELVAIPGSHAHWDTLRPAIWHCAVDSRLINDIATVERDREEGRANALFVDSPNEAIAKDRAEALVRENWQLLEAELAKLPPNELTEFLSFITKSMIVITLAMYEGTDFVPPSN